MVHHGNKSFITLSLLPHKHHNVVENFDILLFTCRFLPHSSSIEFACFFPSFIHLL
jgi:hypothetical protein